jgi:hypothetical protein
MIDVDTYDACEADGSDQKQRLSKDPLGDHRL